MKLCKAKDPEPELFASFSGTGIYPKTHATNVCSEYDSIGDFVLQWHAWVTDYASPLDQYLSEPFLPDGASKACVVGAARCMLHAASHGHYMSDNAMFNFGKLLDEIVIIDAGSRPLVQNLMSKLEFNKISMGQFWKKFSSPSRN